MPTDTAAVRVHATLEADGSARGKVTVHAPYASADELPPLEDGAPSTSSLPHVSAEIAFDELSPDIGPALVIRLQEVLAAIREAAQPRLTRRLTDATATARQVAQARHEIAR